MSTLSLTEIQTLARVAAHSGMDHAQLENILSALNVPHQRKVQAHRLYDERLAWIARGYLTEAEAELANEREGIRRMMSRI